MIIRGDCMKKTICIIGGDERNIELAWLLKENDFDVKLYGKEYLNLEDFLKDADCVVSGIPFSRDNETINFPLSTEKISIERLFNSMKSVHKLIAGSISQETKKLAVRYDIELYDFLDDEDFAVYNAIPTAEGALEIALRETKRTINSANCLVLGYGRIGKVLANILKGMNAKVTVAARKYHDFAWIEAMGYKKAEYSDLENILPHVDILFNTVPELIIKEELNYMKKDALIIDLASKPGGIDFELADNLGIKSFLALGLPGKVAPKSVAQYMFNKVVKVN